MIREVKDSNPQISLTRCCRLFGVSRQAHYQDGWFRQKVETNQTVILEQIQSIRSDHPCMGTRKLYEMLQPFLQDHRIKIGRDALFDLLASEQMLVRKRKRKIYTTQSQHWLRKYPDLLPQIKLVRPNQVWVSDITYFKTQSGYVYISLITDAYSHKVVGYSAANNLEAVHNLRSLQMALSKLGPDATVFGVTHHSDRGLQYCCKEYVKLLRSNNISISMTEDGNPLRNAVAERINGIIKNEYLKHYTIKNVSDAEIGVARAVSLYNDKRPHWSCDLKTPASIHDHNINPKRRWKTYYKRKPITEEKIVFSDREEDVNLCQD